MDCGSDVLPKKFRANPKPQIFSQKLYNFGFVTHWSLFLITVWHIFSKCDITCLCKYVYIFK